MGDIRFGIPSDEFRSWCKKEYLGPLCFMTNGVGGDVSLIGWNESIGQQCDIWCHLQYSTDNKETWNTYSGQIVYLDSCTGKKVYFRADPENPNTNGFSDRPGSMRRSYHKFVINSSVAVFGNIQYLLTSDGKRTDVPQYCYYRMFSGCTSLTQAPALPATTLADYCYSSMFQSCASLTQAPVLPATTLANECYNSMFLGCTSLTQAPQLPATTLADYCYELMFYDCPKFSDCHMKASMQGIYNTSTHGDTTKMVIYDL